MPGDKAFDTHEQRAQYDRVGTRFRKLYQHRAGMLRDYDKFANEQVHNLIQQTAPAAADTFAQAKRIGEQYEKEYMPAYSQYLKSATEYDTAGRRQEEGAEAMSDVATAAEASREGALSRLEAYGIDPSMTRGAAMDQNVRLETALAQVKAKRDAEMDVEERGRRYVSDALTRGEGGAALAGDLSRTATGIAGEGIDAANQTANTLTSAYESQQGNLSRQQAVIGATEAAKEYELSGKAGAGSGTDWGAIGSGVGTIAGGAAGAYFGAGNPAAISAGMAMGGQLGGAAGGMAGGGGTQPQQSNVGITSWMAEP